MQQGSTFLFPDVANHATTDDTNDATSAPLLDLVYQICQLVRAIVIIGNPLILFELLHPMDFCVSLEKQTLGAWV